MMLAMRVHALHKYYVFDKQAVAKWLDEIVAQELPAIRRLNAARPGIIKLSPDPEISTSPTLVN